MEEYYLVELFFSIVFDYFQLQTLLRKKIATKRFTDVTAKLSSLKLSITLLPFTIQNEYNT